jgi:heptosyltransferase I
VCIVLLSGVGDVVHGLPLATDLARTRPDVEVTWIAEPVPARVLLHHPAVHRVVVYRSRAGVRGLAALRRDLHGYRADVTLNVQRYLKSVWPTVLSRAPARVGLPPSKTRDAIVLAHTHALEDRPWTHVQDLFLDFRWALGVPRDATPEWGIAFSDEERSAQADFFARLGPDPIAGLVLATANPRKDWPADRYARLARALRADFGFQVVLLGGPSRREREVAAHVMSRVDPPPTDGLADDVRRLMWLVDGCDLVVSPDTGPLHLAHALAVPVIGLFGHTNPARVGPYRRFRHLVVDRYTDPGAEPDASVYVPKLDRMERITVEDVLEKVQVEVARSARG